MTIKTMRQVACHTLASAAVLGLLAGCGGGSNSDGAPAAAMEVPASAGASPEAYVQYIAGMEASDYTKPLGTNAIEPPKVDEAEPLAVD